MPIHRRDFMKLLGVSVASLYLTRCHMNTVGITSTYPEEITCYEAPPNLPTPEPTISSARERLRVYWLRFEELAQSSPEDTENKLGNELTTGHRAALDELITNGELTAPVAGLVQEAYAAAVYHVWRSNVLMTCYIIGAPQYAAASADVLVAQSQVLNQIAEQGTIDPDTLAKAQAALEHDLAFYALSDQEVESLYNQLIKDNQDAGQPIPSFESLTLELTPEAKEATQFIIDLLTNK